MGATHAETGARFVTVSNEEGFFWFPVVPIGKFDVTAERAGFTKQVVTDLEVIVGAHVNVDVTPLMVEAQRLGLSNFQVRIMEDLGPVSPGLIEINDTTGANRATLAPLLSVTYF